MGFVLFGELQIDGRKLDAMLLRFLFGFHLFDFMSRSFTKGNVPRGRKVPGPDSFSRFEPGPVCLRILGGFRLAEGQLRPPAPEEAHREIDQRGP